MTLGPRLPRPAHYLWGGFVNFGAYRFVANVLPPAIASIVFPAFVLLFVLAVLIIEPCAMPHTLECLYHDLWCVLCWLFLTSLDCA